MGILTALADAELRQLLLRKPNPVAYDGFEPSGRMHIAQVRGHTHGISDRLAAAGWLQQLLMALSSMQCGCNCEAPAGCGTVSPPAEVMQQSS